MKSSRRQFLMAAGMASAMARLWPQELKGFQMPTPEQARIDLNLPAEATQGPWRNLRAVREKKVIDFHNHTWETATQAPTLQGTGLLHREAHYVDFAQQLIESMDRYGVAVCVTSPAFVGYERYVNSRWKSYAGRFVLMASLWPPPRGTRPTPAEAATIIRKQLQEDGAKGIGEGGLPEWKSPKDLQPVMDVVMEFDIPVLIHTGWSATASSAQRAERGGAYQAAWRFAEEFGNLAAYYPEAKLILGHTGGRFDFLDGYEALRVAFSFDNVYVETSKSTARIITEAVRGLGAEKVLYGSDWNRPQMKTYGPKHYRNVYQHWYNLNQVALADITEDERDMILYKNAARLLKLRS